MLKLLKHKNKRGFSFIEIMIVLIIIGVLLAVAIPNFNKIRTNTYKDKCSTNLRQIELAKEQWALETGAADTATPTAAQLDPYFKEDIWDEEEEELTKGHTLTCPLDPDGENATFNTSYDIKDIKTDPACKISPSTHKLD